MTLDEALKHFSSQNGRELELCFRHEYKHKLGYRWTWKVQHFPCPSPMTNCVWNGFETFEECQQDLIKFLLL